MNGPSFHAAVRFDLATYTPPLDDIRFLFEAFDYEGQIQSMPAFEDFDLDTSMSMLEEYAKFCVEELRELGFKGDQVGV